VIGYTFGTFLQAGGSPTGSPNRHYGTAYYVTTAEG
jgi:hypothetical protein